MATNYNSIGKLAATFGVKGELVLVHHLGQKTALKGVQAIFIEIKRDELLPYFVEEARVKNDTELFIKLEGINSKEEARNFLQKQVWLPEETVQQFTNKTAPISYLGFHIIDNGNDIGEILEVIEQPHQILCRIDLEGKEALIPMHAQTLLKVDKKKKELHVNLPDGLLDIFR